MNRLYITNDPMYDVVILDLNTAVVSFESSELLPTRANCYLASWRGLPECTLQPILVSDWPEISVGNVLVYQPI